MIRFKHETLLLLTVLAFVLLLTPTGLYPSTTPKTGWLIQPVFADSNGQYASLVLGQSPPSFTTSLTATTQNAMSTPNGVVFDSHGNLWVTDFFNNRVLEFTPPFTNGMSAALVLGQPDFTTGTANTASGFTSSSCNTGTINPCGMNNPNDAGFDSHGNLWVVEFLNNRVLEFTPPFTNGMSAALVLGQPDFTTGTANTHLGFTSSSCNTGTINPCGMRTPNGVVFDSHSNLWVTDFLNNRVLEFACTASSSCANGNAADLVLGQADFTHSTFAATNKGMRSPSGVGVDSHGNLWVADRNNNRVLEFTCTASSSCVNGNAADLVLGQADFLLHPATTTPNRMSGPHGLGFDSSGDIWVADRDNNRVLEFTCTASSSCVNGSAADLVLGQADFTHSTAATTQNGMRAPSRVVCDSGGNIWVPDSTNNRVLEFWVNEGAADSSTVTLDGGGGGSFASSLTGVTVTISGSTGGASVFIVAQQLSSLSSGVGRLFLSNGKFFDVAISGVTTGTAQVCVPDSSADSKTILQYWSGSAWVTASGITVTGTTVCGNIPVSALQGTNIGAGDPIPSQKFYPVGGEMVPINQLQVLVPWLVLIAALSILSVETLVRRRRTRDN